MPIPDKRKNEDKQNFVARCMGDEVMKKDYPDTKQRIAVCLSQSKPKGKSSLIEEVHDHLLADNYLWDDTWDEFVKLLEGKGGFISAHWDGTGETEQKIKEMTKATIRCIPLNNTQEEGKCILTGNPSKERVLFAIAY
jgi:hypothetical protein